MARFLFKCSCCSPNVRQLLFGALGCFMACTADAHTGLVILSERSVDSSVDWSVVVVLPLAHIRHAEMDEFDPRHVSLCEAHQPGGG